jgi:peroxiredoxin
MPSRASLPLLLLPGLALCWPLAARAADAETDWKTVTALDAGPRATPGSQQEARAAAAGHLAAQEKATRAFLAAHPQDAHAFEARLRLARVLQIRAGLEKTEAPRTEARRILDELNQAATPEQRVEVDFARITFQMRKVSEATARDREQLLLSTRRFQVEHPTDRRLPRLLAEIATLYDAEPETKRSLLLSAQAGAQGDELKSRIADDLKRIEQLGKPVSLRFTTTQNKAIDLEESRGKVVLLVFFANWSPPSIEALTKLQRVVKDLPKDHLQVLCISLDNKLEETAATINKNTVTWPVGFDGKGWASPTVRALGINTLPTVWLIDQNGVLRSLNALESTSDQVLKLLHKPPAP